MATEEYSSGYEEGRQDGWNAAMESLPAQQEPVATYHGSNDFGHDVIELEKALPIGAKLYTSPPAPVQQEAVTKIISNLEPLLAAKNQSWAYAENMLLELLAAVPQPAQQEPVALPEKIYEFVPTPEPAKWHHPECEGECIACLIERVVQEAYGSQGLGYLQRHLTSPQRDQLPEAPF